MALRAEALGTTAGLSIDFLERLFPNVTYVRIVRRDLDRQAVSLWYALNTGTWSVATDDSSDAERADVPYSHEGIERCRSAIESADAEWDRLLRFNGIDPIEVVYEELDASYAQTIERVARRVTTAEGPITVLPPADAAAQRPRHAGLPGTARARSTRAIHSFDG